MCVFLVDGMSLSISSVCLLKEQAVKLTISFAEFCRVNYPRAEGRLSNDLNQLAAYDSYSQLTGNLYRPLTQLSQSLPRSNSEPTLQKGLGRLDQFCT